MANGERLREALRFELAASGTELKGGRFAVSKDACKPEERYAIDISELDGLSAQLRDEKGASVGEPVPSDAFLAGSSVKRERLARKTAGRLKRHDPVPAEDLFTTTSVLEGSRLLPTDLKVKEVFEEETERGNPPGPTRREIRSHGFHMICPGEIILER